MEQRRLDLWMKLQMTARQLKRSAEQAIDALTVRTTLNQSDMVFRRSDTLIGRYTGPHGDALMHMH